MLTGTPAFLRVIFSNCVVVPGCPNRRFDALIIPTVLLIQSALILWVTDQVRAALEGKRFAAAVTVLNGLFVASGLAVLT
jgi:hypothetical protein